jgi:deoxyribodipyrimidine photo-lyase
MDLPATSGLSPYLRFGLVSPWAVLAAADTAAREAPHPEARRSAEIWRDQLVWREYFVSLLASAPRLRTLPLRVRFVRFAWREDEAGLRAWEEGRTGFPVVDAAMRQLRETGWIHNRARLVAASFLSRLLLVDWRWGEQVFFHLLVDGDPALNAGNWQWTAGVGSDAAPYVPLFNPVRQGQRFDPHGEYVKRWVPELRRVPPPYVHAPWTLPRDDQIAYRCRVGRDYPAPLVDLGSARERAVRAFGGGLHKPLRPPTGRVRS